MYRRRMGHLQEGVGHLQRFNLQEEKRITCRMLEKFRGNVRKQTWSQPKMNQNCHEIVKAVSMHSHR